MLNSKSYISIKLPALWAVSITMGCTAAGLTGLSALNFLLCDFYSSQFNAFSTILLYHSCSLWLSEAIDFEYSKNDFTCCGLGV